MLLSTLAGLLPFLASAQAYFILSQSILQTTRLDPIVNPGGIGTHVHSIAGGSNFDKSMTYASSRASKCTTAPVSVDLSNYWIPQMYYYNPADTSYQAIPVANMNAYYLPRAGKDGIVKAFPDGLRMLSGTPGRRDFDSSDPNDKAISYVCLDYSGAHTNDPAYAQRNSFFAHNCPQGMRAQVNFPPCWDGVNLDSDDHQSHMAWPSGGVDGGECPASHPEHLVSLFYEFIYNVQDFPFNNASQPTWVFANGDSTGYGLHADFINGWPELINGTNVLQRAINECNANNGVGGDLQNCPPFVPYLQQGGSCGPENPYVNEDVGMGHPIPSLPGNNPLWMGTGTKPEDPDYSDANTTFTTFASTIPTGYADVGCIAEGPNGRALTGAHYSNSNVTRGACVSFCQSYGFPLAGVEWGQECYCGVQMSNGASNTTLLPASQCSKPCANNAYENCGGPSTLELFSNPSLYPASSVPSGWSALGCVREATNARALPAASTTSNSMTVATCLNFCASKGFQYGGIQYAGECYCDSALRNGITVNSTSTACNMACSGDSLAICGGPSAISLFVNPAFGPAISSTKAISSSTSTVANSTKAVSTSASANATVKASISSSTNVAATSVKSSTVVIPTSTNSTSSTATPASSTGSVVTSSSSMAAGSANSTKDASTGVSTTATAGPSVPTTNTNSSSPVISSSSTTVSSTITAVTNSSTTTIASTSSSSVIKSSSVIAPVNSTTSSSTSTATSSSTTASSTSTAVSSSTTAVSSSTVTTSSTTPAKSSSTTIATSTSTSTLIPSSSTPTSSITAGTSTSTAVSSSTTAVSSSTVTTSSTTPAKSSSTTIATSTSTSTLIPSSSTPTSSITAGTSTSTAVSSSSTVSSSTTVTLSSTTPVKSSSTSIVTSTSTSTPIPSSSTPTSTSTTSTASATPSTVVPAGWSLASSPCVAEASSGRALRGASMTNSLMTTAMCLNFCGSKGYQYAGIEYASECYCSSTFSQGASLSRTSTNCNMGCSGAKSETCGGGGALTVYVNPSLAPTMPATVGAYSYKGCIAEPSSGRALTSSNYNSNSMTIETCVSYCQGKGFTIAGMEYSTQCWCGSAYSGGTSPSTQSDNCFMQCGGNSTEICGGPGTLTIYQV